VKHLTHIADFTDTKHYNLFFFHIRKSNFEKLLNGIFNMLHQFNKQPPG